MPTFTKNLGLTKPDENDFYNQQTEQCENWDKLDEWSEEVDKKTVGATSSVPGIVKYGTDSSTALEGHRMAQSLGVGKFGGDVQTAGTKKVGYAYWCTVNKDMYVCKVENSLNYIDAAYFEAFSNNALLGKLNNLENNYSQTPIGSVVPFIGSTIPIGWLPCDGREIKEADYPDLYKLLQFGRKVHITDEDIAMNSHHRVPTLKSNDDGQGYVVSASSEYSTAYQAWRAFDNLYANTNAWITTNGVLEGWLQIDYPNEVCIDSLDLTSRNDTTGYAINYVQVQGIKSNGTFIDLFEGQPVAEFTRNETRRFGCSEKRTKFKSFRVTVKTASNFASIGELKLYTHNLLDEIPNEIANQDPTKKYLPFMNGMIPKGNTVGRDLGSYEFDAIRNITGEMDSSRENEWLFPEEVSNIDTKGCIEVKTSKNSTIVGSSDNPGTANFNIDASRVVPVSNENRPKNISFNYIIKASTVHNPSTAVDIADELNRKIEVNRNSIISLDDKVDSYENRFEDVVLWEGLHQTNGTITLSEPFTNFREIEVIVSSYASGGLDNIAHRRLLSKNIVFNDTDTADNKPNECRFGIDSDGNAGVMFKTVYFRLNKKDIYFGSRSSSCTISKITGIGRVK